MNNAEFNSNNNSNSTASSPTLVADIAQRTADKADHAVSATKKVVSDSAAAVNDGLDQFQASSQSTLINAANQADELARKGIEQARRASAAIRETAQETGDRTVAYIRDQPVKSVLFAAAAGALIAMALGRNHSSR